jgi:RimJ/RimL family protein N-acetyltransferase
VYGEVLDRSYLLNEFFRKSGATVCLWVEGKQGVSALRLEPWKDGFLLAALETAPTQRRQGYAGGLLKAVKAHLTEQGRGKLYCHIHHRNTVSIRVHVRCGFRKISDTAVLLDDTVTARMGTYLWE